MKHIKLIRSLISFLLIIFMTLVISKNIGSDGWTLLRTSTRSTLGVVFQTVSSRESQAHTATSQAGGINQKNPASIINKTKPVPFCQKGTSQFAKITGRLGDGATLASSLVDKKVPAKARIQVINNLGTQLDLRRLKPSDQYTIILDQKGDLKSCVYNTGPLESYSIYAYGDSYKTRKQPVSIDIKTTRLSGTITSSLFASFASQHENHKLIYAFADIFASRIDFNTETHIGDTYSLVFDKYFKNGTFVGYGKIKAASYQGKNVSLKAYYYQNSKKNSAYFDEDGQALGALLIRSPLPMGRLTSKFSYHRRHPITGKIQPHLGIDLAAPTGTPIMAAGDGRIISIGRNGGNGKQIIIAHSGGYRTYYGHMSRYKTGLHRGSKIHKKDIIGYVGSTGIATGPHLDYRIRHNGVFKNPFSITFKPKLILSKKDIVDFSRQVQSLALLMKGQNTVDHQIIKVSSVTLFDQEKNNITLL